MASGSDKGAEESDCNESDKESDDKSEEEVILVGESTKSACKVGKRKAPWEQESKRPLYTQLTFSKKGLREAMAENKKLAAEIKSLRKTLADLVPMRDTLVDLCVTHNGVKDELCCAYM